MDDEHSKGPVINLFLERFPQIGEDVWRSRFQRELVLVFGTPLKPKDRLSPGTVIQYYREVEKEPEANTDYGIVFQDDHILVVDKPHNLPTTPSGDYINKNLVTILRVDLKLDYLSPIHRLDKDTAGLVLFAKTREAASQLVEQVRQQTIDRTYRASVSSWDKELPCAIDEPLIREEKGGNPLLTQVHPDGKSSTTEVIDAEEKGETTVLTIKPKTGRQHQIRVHLAHVGHPVLGDPLYGEARETGLALCCYQLEFAHPVTGECLKFRSERD
jgi:tRNA pseudouridine32 synthase/23S rRNA pseudouridine746 synthase